MRLCRGFWSGLQKFSHLNLVFFVLFHVFLTIVELCNIFTDYPYDTHKKTAHRKPSFLPTIIVLPQGWCQQLVCLDLHSTPPLISQPARSSPPSMRPLLVHLHRVVHSASTDLSRRQRSPCYHVDDDENYCERVINSHTEYMDAKNMAILGFYHTKNGTASQNFLQTISETQLINVTIGGA